MKDASSRTAPRIPGDLRLAIARRPWPAQSTAGDTGGHIAEHVDERGDSLSGCHVWQSEQSGAVRGYWIDLAVRARHDVRLADELQWLVTAAGIERYMLRGEGDGRRAWADLVTFVNALVGRRVGNVGGYYSAASRSMSRIFEWIEALDRFGCGITDEIPDDLSVDDTPVWLDRLLACAHHGDLKLRARMAAALLLAIANSAGHNSRFVRELLSTAAVALPELPDDCAAQLFYRAAMISLWMVDLDGASECFDLGTEAASAAGAAVLLDACVNGQRTCERVATLVDSAMSELVVEYERLEMSGNHVGRDSRACRNLDE